MLGNQKCRIFLAIIVAVSITSGLFLLGHISSLHQHSKSVSVSLYGFHFVVSETDKLGLALFAPEKYVELYLNKSG
jgi:hypothetical protein